MQEILVNGLLATVYGMSGVFPVLILFYGLALLLMHVALKQEDKSKE